jgi:hypothetical protein
MNRFMAILIASFTFVAFVEANELDTALEEKSYYTSKLDKTKFAMFAYIIEHKMATSAIIATGGGLGAFLQENMDESTRNGVMIIGILGLSYCLNNAQECASTTAELTSYAAMINGLEKKINSLNSNITSIHQSYLISGSNTQGPKYDEKFPDGIYTNNGDEVKLVFFQDTIANNELSTAKSLADKAESKLHVASNDYYYALLEKSKILILKHTSNFKQIEEVSGLGITLPKKNEGEYIKVNEVLDDSPAQTSGVRTGDMILKINNLTTIGMTEADSVKLLRGEKGTKVKLVVSRYTPGNTSNILLDFEIERSLVKFNTTQSATGYLGIIRTNEGDYLYFRNDENGYHALPKGEKISVQWNVGKTAIVINIVRPNANEDNKGREVDYSFIIKDNI